MSTRLDHASVPTDRRDAPHPRRGLRRLRRLLAVMHVLAGLCGAGVAAVYVAIAVVDPRAWVGICLLLAACALVIGLPCLVGGILALARTPRRRRCGLALLVLEAVATAGAMVHNHAGYLGDVPGLGLALVVLDLALLGLASVDGIDWTAATAEIGEIGGRQP